MNKKKRHSPNNDKLEEQIQVETRRRVLEKEEAIEEEKQEEIQTEATIEALEEITEVPHKEVEEIAHQVREEYTSDYKHSIARKQAILKASLLGVIVVAILLLIIGVIWYHNHRKTVDIPYEAVSITESDKSEKPVSNLDEVSINVDRIYLYVTWQSLSKGIRKYRIRVFDGAGSLAWDSDWGFYSKETSHNTWSWYHPKKGKDKPR